MIYTILILIFLAAPALANDTVWVETSYQKNARHEYEQKQRDLEGSAGNINDAIGTIRRVRSIGYSKTMLDQVLAGIDASEIGITERDRDIYIRKLKDSLASLKVRYEENMQFLALCELDVKSGPYYIRTQALLYAVNDLTEPQINSLKERKQCSPEGQYYEWDDWVNLVLSRRLRR